MISYTLNRYKNRLLEQIYKKNKDLKPAALKSLRTLDSINLKGSLTQTQYVVIDTELTGLDTKKDSILSIGALTMTGSIIMLGNYFYRIIDPLSCVNPETVVIHGITPSEASSCPTIDRILPEFIDYCRNKVIVGHCVSIDLEFINKEMKRLYGFGLTNPVVDTLKLYWWYKKRRLGYDAFFDDVGLTTSSLFEIARELGVPVQDIHTAISDAYITAQIFQRHLHFLMRKGVNTLSELIRIGRP